MKGSRYKYYDFVLAAFVIDLLCSDVIGVSKVTQVDWQFSLFGFSFGPFVFGSAVMFFPISYVFGDILTEVYGYARARRVVWAGFAGLAYASFMSWAVLAIPAAPGWENQKAFEVVFGSTWRIVLASLTAFWAGEFVNSFVLAKMKIWTSGRWLFTRTIGSTIVGQAVDSSIFYPLAFLKVGPLQQGWPPELMVKVMFANFLIKVGVEVMMTPLTYAIVGFLKKAEQEDYYDRTTNFTPFKLEE